MRTQFIITITVEAEESDDGHSTDLRKATEVACERMTEFDSDIKIIDTHVDYVN
jgi:hypothetical protein